MRGNSFTQKVTGRTVKYVEPVPRGSAAGLVSDVYAQARREFDLVPPLTIHSPVDEVLAAFWVLAREAYIVGQRGRSDREIVAAWIAPSSLTGSADAGSHPYGRLA